MGLRSVLPTTAERVPRHTAPEINERIRRQTAENVSRYRNAPPAEIERRLAELSREWDIERAIEANAASLGLVGIVLGAFLDIWFLLLPAAVGTFLLQHALQGWCPPVPVLRRLGFRTSREIFEERLALLAATRQRAGRRVTPDTRRSRASRADR
jgi:hypothetical protein